MRSMPAGMQRTIGEARNGSPRVVVLGAPVYPDGTDSKAGHPPWVPSRSLRENTAIKILVCCPQPHPSTNYQLWPPVVEASIRSVPAGTQRIIREKKMDRRIVVLSLLVY